jgi:ATP:corrinoid adenosyltransferase
VEVIVIDFIKTQIEISEKLFQAMSQDNKQWQGQVNLWADLNKSLLEKIKERDETIQHLRAKLQAYEASESL